MGRRRLGPSLISLSNWWLSSSSIIWILNDRLVLFSNNKGELKIRIYRLSDISSFKVWVILIGFSSILSVLKPAIIRSRDIPFISENFSLRKIEGVISRILILFSDWDENENSYYPSFFWLLELKIDNELFLMGKTALPQFFIYILFISLDYSPKRGEIISIYFFSFCSN